jgi:prevent-host-death family protein
VSSEKYTVEEARAKLGDLVLAAMRGEETLITRYGRPAARIVPIEEKTMASTRDLADAVTTTLGDRADDYDIDAIVEAIGDKYGRDIPNIDAVPSDEYWEIVEQHDKSA